MPPVVSIVLLLNSNTTPPASVKPVVTLEYAIWLLAVTLMGFVTVNERGLPVGAASIVLQRAAGKINAAVSIADAGKTYVIRIRLITDSQRTCQDRRLATITITRAADNQQAGTRLRETAVRRSRPIHNVAGNNESTTAAACAGYHRDRRIVGGQCNCHLTAVAIDLRVGRSVNVKRKVAANLHFLHRRIERGARGVFERAAIDGKLGGGTCRRAKNLIVANADRCPRS